MTGPTCSVRRHVAIVAWAAVVGWLVLLSDRPGAARTPMAASPGPRSGCELHLDRPAVHPGESPVLVGAGFRSGAVVEVRLDGTRAGRATTDARGRFTFALPVPGGGDGISSTVVAASGRTTCSMRAARAETLPTAVTRPGPSRPPRGAATPVIAATVIAMFLAACALLFLTVGRRRRL